MDWLATGFDAAQQWLFEAVVQPLLFAGGMANFLEDGYRATGWLLVGLLQLVVIVGLLVPLQRWRPVEAITDRGAVRTDIIYTLLHRLGIFRVGLFLALDPLWDTFFGALSVGGITTFQLDSIWPGITDIPWVSLLLYLAVFDLLDYWIHRGQHRFEWWWRLHALHHSQRQLTVWSDNRNHLLDDILRDSIIVLVAQLIGVAPGQFVAIVALTQLSESFQHANLRLWFGPVGERLWISPRFHRLHHALYAGHALTPKTVGSSNFGVLLPWWDMLFGTANFERRFDPTGVYDQIEPGPDGRVRDYGQGFWAQQWRGLLRLAGRA
ncbi:sterol desaturase family protein [Simplicispira metamorpha]|uniref:Fatty acid hydroxylase family protein n=1 Tax=Simplicispira metamorpha TaxID=80881 RepID=A0A4R2NB52_9BURK|nr:sterol desaturase family protein [Simplicispira metamorpha]TCP18215.1 fatty acid hydroxylase family protein [Simplicispira metamorpha]